MSVVQCVTELPPSFLSVLNCAELSPSRRLTVPQGCFYKMWIHDQHPQKRPSIKRNGCGEKNEAILETNTEKH